MISLYYLVILMAFTDNNYQHIVILDLEGKQEITEISSVIIDTNLQVIDSIQLFIKNYYVCDKDFTNYVNYKYGRFSMNEKFFNECDTLYRQMRRYDNWIKSAIDPNKCIFLTCGNWDLRKQIPKQFPRYRVRIPDYFRRYINIKDVFTRLEGIESKGMDFMMNYYNLKLMGNHHCAYDDVFNIAQVLYHILNKIILYSHNINNYFIIN